MNSNNAFVMTALLHAAEAERDELAARIARVEWMHQPIKRFYYHATVTECSLCFGRIYPCPTIKTLRGESE